MKTSILSRLSVKLILVISAVLLINLLVYTIITVRDLKQQITSACVLNAYNMSDIVKKSARYSMMLNRSDDIHQIVKTVGTEKGVYKLRVYNKIGSVKYSSDSTELGRSIDMNSESCNACHSGGKVLKNLPFEKMIRFYENEEGKRVLGFINPIYNEPDCSNADCHYHPPEKAILGVLDLIIFTNKIDAITDTNVRNFIAGSILITLLIAISTAIAIGLVVNSPLRKIREGIHQLAAGNLTYKIDVESNDELGDTAHLFNNMAEQLDKAYTEIKNWNETLHIKVREKNEELKKIYDQIVHVEKLASLGKLSATVAHELNNPLEGILTYSKLIAKMLQKQNQAGKHDNLIKYLTLISDESARCGRIVKDLLLFSHTGGNPYQLQDLRVIIDKALTLINHHLEIHKIRLVKVMDHGQISVNCDVQKIEQALLTIIMNAIEAMPDGGKLTVIASKADNTAMVLVKDEGPGICEKDLPNIFDPFYSTKKDKKGTGLGLSVCYGIIMQHKGSVSVEETSEKGTTFKVLLPLHEKAKDA
ncbi:MAG: HAMP domain-containing histidine kinase [Ignavibacteria bacterium]|nr:HAMP domain-containing histidine kinase [Ignavibacteria bacterium]